MGKSTISMVMFNSYVNVYQGVSLNGNVLDELLELLSVSEGTQSNNPSAKGSFIFCTKRWTGTCWLGLLTSH